MLLQEQLYKRLNRLYYHGQTFKNRDRSLSMFNCYYLSTDPYYAYTFSGRNGVIKVQRLKQSLNLCNIRSKKDQRKVEDLCRQQKLFDPSKLVKALAEQDWIGALGSIQARELFLDILKALGYDGFFNIEDIDNIRGSITRLTKNDEDSKGFPSIGVFDESCLTTVQTIQGYENFLELPGMLGIKEKEINYLKTELYKIYDEYGELKESKVLQVLKYLEELPPVISQEEVLNILNNFNPEEGKKILNERVKISICHYRDWNMCEPSEEDIERIRKRVYGLSSIL